MPEGRWADWQVREIAESFGDKRPKREWFDSDDRYYTSLKSWAHLCAHQLHTLVLEERQLVIFLYHLGIEHIGVETFDPQDKGLNSDFQPQESRAPHREIL